MFLNLKIMIFCLLLFYSFPTIQASAAEKIYQISYGSGSLFHQLVRNKTSQVYKKAGLQAEFTPMPLNRSLISADEGLVDGDAGRVPSIEESYSNLRRVNVKLMDLKGAVYTSHPDITKYHDQLLKSTRIGYVLGVRWAEKLLAGIETTTANTYASLFKMLAEGRIDIAFATETSANAALEKMEKENIKQLHPFIFTAPIYHYVHKKNANIIPKLAAAASELNQPTALRFYAGIKSPSFEILQARLSEACLRIGHVCHVKNVGSAERALVLANEEGDGDIWRIAKIKEVSPEQTSNLMVIPESILNADFYAYSNKQTSDLKDWNSLTGLRNGFRVGAKVLEKNVPGERTLLPETEPLLQMLADKRLDTVIEIEDLADYAIQKLQLKNIYKSKRPLLSVPGHSLLHIKHGDLLQKLANSLAEMKADGSFDRIKIETMEKLLAARHKQ